MANKLGQRWNVFFFLQIKACRGGLQIAQMVKSRKKNKILQGIQKLEELT